MFLLRYREFGLCILTDVQVDEAICVMLPYTDWQHCVPQAVRDSWNHYQWAGDRDQQPAWAKYQKHAHLIFLRSGPEGLDALKRRLDAFMQPDPDGSTRTAAEIETFMNNIREDMQKRMDQRRAVENWEGFRRVSHKSETKEVVHARITEVARKAAEMTPPIQQEDLEKLQAFKLTSLIAKPLTERSWKELRPKLISQLEDLRVQQARAAKEAEALRLIREESDRKVAEARVLEHEEMTRITKARVDHETAGRLQMGHCPFSGNMCAADLYPSNHTPMGLDADSSSGLVSSLGGMNANSITSPHRHLPPINTFWVQHPHS